MKVEEVNAIQEVDYEREKFAVVDAAQRRYLAERALHWNDVARWTDRHRGLGSAYHRRLVAIYRFLIPAASRVLEIGCGRGDLLAALKPAYGVGIDFSAEMIARAREDHPEIQFVQADAHAFDLVQDFDFIILSDVVNDLWDAQTVFAQIRKLATSRTRVLLNFYNRLWELPLAAARRLGLAKPNLDQNWFTVEDITGLLALADFEVIRHRTDVLLPLPIPLLGAFADRYLAKIWPFSAFALTHVLVARPVPATKQINAREKLPTVSVVVAARNESGNIPAIFARVPELGRSTELVFVEGGSLDNTYEAIQFEMANNPHRQSQLLKQRGKGKGDAVRLGFQHATGELLLILDADLTVPPEDLPRFVEALVSGKTDFANGSRLVYPMEKDAMRFFNLLGNKFFSVAFSWLLGQPIKDTLCGTKALWRVDYETIAANRSYFGDFDPFGDFDLLFGAAKASMKIVDIPIRYRDRSYGETNIQRWRHGWLLLRMVVFAARRIKFI
ncbi:MAG TPA: glycosyltransferase [Pyrinomonadaceae bacterium]|nr:glycosyltransferase [Pyrinomonadaceae bacterium]